MPVIDVDSLTPTQFVERRIRRDWRGDILVIDSGEDDGGLSWVEIASASPIACEQARISLASFVRNERDDWLDWPTHEDSEHPFRLRLIDPTVEGHEEAAADQDDELAA